MGLVVLLLDNIRLVSLLFFRFAWPEDIQKLYFKSFINNSSLYCDDLFLLWLIIEEVFPELRSAYVALWSDNSSTVVWIKYLVACGSKISMQFLLALTLCVKQKGASPLTPFHIQGKQNVITGILSRSFGSNLAWFCKTDSDLHYLFN